MMLQFFYADNTLRSWAVELELHCYYIFTLMVRRHLEEHLLLVRLKEDWSQVFIILLSQATVKLGSNAGNNGVQPEFGFVT